MSGADPPSRWLSWVFATQERKKERQEKIPHSILRSLWSFEVSHHQWHYLPLCLSCHERFIYCVFTKDTLDEKGQARDTSTHVTFNGLNSTKNSPVAAGWNPQLLANWIGKKRLSKRYVWPKKCLNSTFWFVTRSRSWVLLTWRAAVDLVRGRFIALPHAQ